MAQEIAFECGWIFKFEGLMTLTLHHSSTSTYMPNFMEIEETFCGRTDGRTDGHLRPTLLGQLRRVDLKTHSHLADTFQYYPTNVQGILAGEVSFTGQNILQAHSHND